MLTIRYFDIVTESTSTTVTVVPAAEIIMILGEEEFHVATFVDYTSPEVLRLCHVIDVAA